MLGVMLCYAGMYYSSMYCAARGAMCMCVCARALPRPGNIMYRYRSQRRYIIQKPHANLLPVTPRGRISA